MRTTTNDEAVAHLMNFAKSGPIVQLFIMDALGKMADRVAALTDEEAEQQLGCNGFINPIAWRNGAREVKQTLADHFAGKRLVPVNDEEDDEDE
jgi:hypothetical protein